MTPENKVKARVKEVLHANEVYYMMPVQAGFGRPGLDFHCIHMGHGFCIETKAPGKRPTKLQGLTIEQIRAAGGTCFVIDGTGDSVDELEAWLFARTVEGM